MHVMYVCTYKCTCTHYMYMYTHTKVYREKIRDGIERVGTVTAQSFVCLSTGHVISGSL